MNDFFRWFDYIVIVTVIIMSLLSCSGKRPTNIGVHNSTLTPCPAKPNCVSSDARGSHNVEPLFLGNLSASDAWTLAVKVVDNLHRVTIIRQTETYLHAECQSAILGFVDDLELHLRGAERIIAVRSASRLGRSDFGINRKRIDDLRKTLINQGMVN